jgi:hypothetical protein
MAHEPNREELLARIEQRAGQRHRTRRRVEAALGGVALVAVIAFGVSVATRPAARLQTAAGTTTTDSAAPPPVACPTPMGKYTQAQLEAIRPDVDAMVDMFGLVHHSTGDGVFYSTGLGANAIQVTLFPAHEDLAAQLLGRFGDAVEVTVGSTPYCGTPGISPACPALPRFDDVPPGLTLTLALAAPTASRAAGWISGKLTVHNDGPAPLTMDPGQPVIGYLVAPGTRDVVAEFSGSIAGTGFELNLAAGDQADIDVIIGTSLCGGGVGSALAPGTYGARAGIGPNEGPATCLAPEVPITITD